METSSFQTIFEWVAHNPFLAAFVIFLISLSESLIIVGLFIPGVLIMGIIGAFVGMGYLNIWVVLIAAILGAIVGDGISFWIGRYYKERLRSLWLFRNYSKLIIKGENFFHKHGGKSIVIGRFIGPVRPIIPAIAGMLHMNPHYFTFVNVLSAILWAPIYMFPGLLFGSSLSVLPPGVATKLAIIAFIILAIIWFVIKLIRIIVQYIYHHYKNFNEFCYRYCIKHGYTKILNVFHNEDDLNSPSIFQGILILVSFVFFIILSINVVTKGDITYLNTYAHHFTRGLYNQYIAAFFAIFSLLYDKYIAILVFGFVCLYLFYKKHYRELTAAIILIVSSVIVIYGLKDLFDNPRPQDLFKVRNLNSYPSGHTILVTVIWGYMTIILARAGIAYNSLKKYFNIALVSIITVICFSRLYLGDHWVGDIIASLLLSLIIILSVNIAYKRKPVSKNINYYEFIIVFIGVTIVIGAPFVYFKLNDSLKNHQPVFEYETISYKEWIDNNKNLLPIKRSGLLNNKVSILNIQWADDIDNITKILEKNGWQKLPKFNFPNVLHNFKKDADAKSIAMLPSFHKDKSFKESFIKEENNQIITIRLWQSHFQLNDNTPIWIGTINKASLKRYASSFYAIDNQPKNETNKVVETFYNSVKNNKSYQLNLLTNHGFNVVLIGQKK